MVLFLITYLAAGGTLLLALRQGGGLKGLTAPGATARSGVILLGWPLLGAVLAYEQLVKGEPK